MHSTFSLTATKPGHKMLDGELENFQIDKIDVPAKKKKALKPELVQEIAQSILEQGQQTPIFVRTSHGRFMLVEGLHRLEACKALGEDTIVGMLVSAETARQVSCSAERTETDADHQKMFRLRKLRLEKEAATKLAATKQAVTMQAATKQTMVVKASHQSRRVGPNAKVMTS
jgi:ParB/RepB/Spo0J family partition protein